MFLKDLGAFAWRVVLQVIGAVARIFSITIAPPGRPTNCEDPGTAVCGSNPRQCGTTGAAAYGPTGGLADYSACGPGPHTLVRTQGGFTGLDGAARTELSFAPAPIVTVQLVHFSQPARVDALGSGPAQVQFMKPTPNVLQELRFVGQGINRIVVTPASPTDITLILGWCH